MKNLNMDSFMDAHRAKCALRVAIYSLYNENDFIFCSTTNRTELKQAHVCFGGYAGAYTSDRALV